ncbi:expressed protein [Arabidopsis lyrata subsp. lyrata]|uniref:Expressed protein n=1 Tax=Arabidopsis lyrata subsp. lyrata TaxID=81972 RepID=D7KAZ3_ARALL|nr:expressed protein [Arabidopsis lyrata subsp. lyrata]
MSHPSLRRLEHFFLLFVLFVVCCVKHKFGGLHFQTYSCLSSTFLSTAYVSLNIIPKLDHQLF